MTTWLALAALTLVPFLLMVTTSFVKISVVFSILRSALGTAQVPSGAIVTALAAILSLYVMAPVARQIVDQAGGALARIDRDDPLSEESTPSVLSAVQDGAKPLTAFLQRNAGDREQALFVRLSKERAAKADVAPEKAFEADSFLVALPAFLITELAEAFQIGFLIFVPFLIIDLVVANVLLALGMHMLSPTTVSAPFKLLLFVVVDGWFILSEALVSGYA